MGLAESVLYMSSIKTGENITQSNLSDAAGVTEVTLRNRYKDLMNRLAKLEIYASTSLSIHMC
jgi:transcription initiation factor TFIIB